MVIPTKPTDVCRYACILPVISSEAQFSTCKSQKRGMCRAQPVYSCISLTITTVQLDHSGSSVTHVAAKRIPDLHVWSVATRIYLIIHMNSWISGVLVL